MRVLVVEDDALLGELVLQALTDEGHVATHATNPERAYALLETGEWDAFIVDAFGGSHLAPDATYAAVVQRFAERGPVIVTTGRAWADTVDPDQIGASSVLAKPYDLDTLLNLLERLHAATPSRRS
jgi:DNA-binding response OmpR family regulator